uniref:uncharacterized protein n=1 Tax=Myxine glutinosa TaxID=7769 RepID=UPI0035900344
MDFGALGFLPGFPEGRSPLLHDQDPQLPPGEDDPDPTPPDHLHGGLSGATERSGDDSGGRGDNEELKDPLLSAAAELLEEGAVGELGDVPPCRIFDATRIWRLALYPADGSVPASTAAFYSDSPRDDSQGPSSPATQPEESSSPETGVPEGDTLTSQTPSNGQDKGLGEGGAGEVYEGNVGAEKFRGARAKEQSQTTQACGQCGKMFRSSSALNKHFLSHSQERRHVCCVCQKAFKRQDHLASHMVTHQKSKPFGCCVINCGKSYCDLRSLRRHYEAHHKHMALGEEGRGTAGISSEVIGAVMTPELVQQMLPPVLELLSPLAQPAPPTSPVQSAGSTGAAIVTVLHTASQSNLQEGEQNEAMPGKDSGEAIGHLTVVSRGNDARPPLTPEITVLHTPEPTRPASWPHPNPAPGTSPHLTLPPPTEPLVPEVKGQQKLDSFVHAFARRRPSLLAALEARGFIAGEVRTGEPLQQQQQQQLPPYRAHASVSVAKLSPCSVPPQPPPPHQFSGPVFEGRSYSVAYQQEQSLLPDNCTTSSPSALVGTPRGWQRPALQATLQALQQHLQPRQTWRPAWGQYHPSGSSTLSFSQDLQNSGVPYVPQAPASPLNQAATSPSPFHPRSLPAHPLTPTSPAPPCLVPPSPTHSRPTQPLPPPSLLTPLSTPPLTSSASSCLEPAWGATQALGQLSQIYPNACRTVMSGNGCASSPRQFAHFSPADMVQHTGVVLHCSPHNSAEGLSMAQHALIVSADVGVPQCAEGQQGAMAPYGKTSQPTTIQQSTTQRGSAQPHTASVSAPSANEQQQGRWEPVAIKEVSHASREAAPRPENVQTLGNNF